MRDVIFMDPKSVINWKVFGILLTVSILHLLFALIIVTILRVAYVRTVPFEFMVDVFPALLVVFQAMGLGMQIFIGLYLGKRVGMGAPLLESWLDGGIIRGRVVSILKLSLVLGIIVAGLKFFVDRFIFSQFVPSLLLQWKQIPFEFRWVIPFQQGIGDEISYRLFWMTILIWIIYKIQKPENNQPATLTFWIPILIVSVFSGLSPLFWGASLLITLQYLFFSYIGGIVFGWLYWKKGIESAIIAHFLSSMVLVCLSFM